MNRIPALLCVFRFSAIVMLFVFLPHHSFAGDLGGEIGRLCNLPEDKIDIAIVSLTLAKELYSDLDVEAYSAKVDEMVQGVGARVGTGGPDGPHVEAAFPIRALCHE